jgi:vacuolar-type H+-ATPase subunit H
MASRKDTERKDDSTTTTTSTTNSTADTTTLSSQQHRQQRQQKEHEEEQHHAIDRALDTTKDNIRKTTDEARRDIPRYTQAVNDYQEQTIQAAREIADSYLESQKEIINSFQSAWSPYAETLFRTNWMSPKSIAELYANLVGNFANNMIAATRLTHNIIFTNMEAFKTSIQQAKDNTKELSRIGVNTAKTFEQTRRDNTRQIDTTRVSVET